MNSIEITNQGEIDLEEMELEENEEIKIDDNVKFKPVEKEKLIKVKDKGFNNLLSKLRFIKKIQKADGYNYNAFCMLANNWLAARNDMVQIAIPITENINCYPKTFQLYDAINTFKKDFKMVANYNTVQIDNEKMKTNIPCTDFETLSLEAPDQISFGITDNLKEVIKQALLFASKKEKEKMFNCLHFDTFSIVASNNIAITQILHNIKLPCEFKLKYKTCKLIVDYPYELKSIGFTDSSVTFYYSNNGFIKCWFENIPDQINVNDAFTYSNDFKVIQLDDGLRQAIAPFNKYVFFKNDKISSRIDEENATIYNYDIELDGIAFDAVSLYNSLFCADRAILDLQNDKLLVIGNEQRCCILTLDL